MAEIIVRFDLRFGRRAVQGALAAAMILLSPPELGSESVTLSTYYPAPSGVYTQMIATGNTWLARDGGAVAIGATTPGIAKAYVSNAGAGVGLYVGNGTPFGQAYIEQDGPAATHIYVAESGTEVFRVGTGGTGYFKSDVAIDGQLTLGAGYVKVDGSAGCIEQWDTTCPGATNACGAGMYATFTPGVYAEGKSLQQQPRINPFIFLRASANSDGTGLALWLRTDDVVMCNTKYYCCPR